MITQLTVNGVLWNTTEVMPPVGKLLVQDTMGVEYEAEAIHGERGLGWKFECNQKTFTGKQKLPNSHILLWRRI